MKNRIVEMIKKQWLLVWSVFAVMALAAMYVSAEYSPTTNKMKRVVRSTSDQGQMFSSNVLAEIDASLPYVPKYKPVLSNNAKETGTYDVDVFLWNYSLSNLAKQYPREIDYDVIFTLTHTDGTPLTADDIGSRTVEIVLVEKDAQTNTETNRELETLGSGKLSYTAERQSLQEGVASQQRYVLKFSGKYWDLQNDTDLCVSVRTVLDASKDYQDLSNLGAVIGLKELVDHGDSGWEAYISESRTGKSPSECDAYNLIVTGSGKAKITIQWDTEKIEFNKNFLDGSIYSFGKYIDETADLSDPNHTVYSYSTRSEVTYTPPQGNSIATLVIHGDTGALLVDEGVTINDHAQFENYAEGSSRWENKNRYDIQLYKKQSIDPANWSFVSPNGGTPNGNVWITVKVEQ